MYKIAFGQQPDAKFKEAALAEYREGSRDLLGLLSVEIMIRAWRAFDKNEKLKCWSFGTMMLYVREYAARQAIRAATTKSPEATPTPTVTPQNSQTASESETFFEKLSPEEQQRFIAEAGTGPVKMSDKILRKIATCLAWKNRNIVLAGA